ncbi:MAG: prolyl oligopeptidase family serine peptidase [Planctomycetes bacterium]|nr:prolyl oligopeptidase family serine peptidase [Planctomycetota bacterium]
MKQPRPVLIACCLSLLVLTTSRALGAETDFPTIRFTSSLDHSSQLARLYLPPESNEKPVPLVVVLHSWSGNYKQESDDTSGMLPHAIERHWAMLMPDFRGPNVKPEACASDLAVQDILDGIAYVQAHAKIDPTRIFIYGASGGGHMTLVMAARAPKTFAAASAWVPIADLAAWHEQSQKLHNNYWKNLEAVTGGAPGASPAVDAEYRKRSPIVLLDNPAVRGLPIDINTGIQDGHTGSVPVSQSMRAFNLLAKLNGHPEAVIPDDQIATMRDDRKVPPPLQWRGQDEPNRRAKILFRRTAGPVRITLNDGGHKGDPAPALLFFDQVIASR